MNGELTIAFFTLIGVLAGYLVNHYLTLREKSVSREFETYQKGMSYLQNLNGFISVLYRRWVFSDYLNDYSYYETHGLTVG